MSEKRFELTKINPTVNPFDTVYLIIDYENPNKEIRTLKDCVDLLNEQQATINALKEENDKLIQKNCIPCELVNLQTREIDKLKEENEQLRKELKEIKENPINYF